MPERVLRPSLEFLQGVTSDHDGPRQETIHAYAILNRGLEQQAIVYSYIDDLRYKVKAKRGAMTH